MQSVFEEQGIQVVGLSYDRPEILREFATRQNLTFPLLSDADSSSLERLGLKNEQAKGMMRGVAFPGLIFLDSEGKIAETFFEQSYADRPTAGTVLARLFPELRAQTTEQPGFGFTQSQTGDTGIAGSEWELQVEFSLPDGAHLYALGNHDYRPLQLTLEENEWFEFGAVRYPTPEVLHLEAIGESVPVFSKTVQLSVPVRVRRGPTTKGLKEPVATELRGRLDYQICTEKSCMLPESKTIVWKATVKPLNRQRASEQWQHQKD